MTDSGDIRREWARVLAEAQREDFMQTFREEADIRERMGSLLADWAESIENYILDQGDESWLQFSPAQRAALGKVHAAIREAQAALGAPEAASEAVDAYIADALKGREQS